VSELAQLADLGVIAGTPVTLLQFSSAFCVPCRATRLYCAEVARTVPGVRHIEVDAESHVDAVRALDVRQTPTVLVVDATGVIRVRVSGAMNRARILAAVAELQPANSGLTASSESR
jgi:thiol-disulfide isomerase/thioredoxin